MTVASEACYAELDWTGVETSFAPGFTAEVAANVTVAYFDGDGFKQSLLAGTHFTASVGTDGAVTVTPIVPAMPPAPARLAFERLTPALQGTSFIDLGRYSAGTHEALFDRVMRIAAELRRRIVASIGPFVTGNDVVDFRPYRLSAADPVNGEDLATKHWVEEATSLINLQGYVDQAEAAVDNAVTAAGNAQGSEIGAEAARDKSEAWAETPENSEVDPGRYSSLHWAKKAQASAASLVPYLALIDYGFFSDAPTETRDYGSFS